MVNVNARSITKEINYYGNTVTVRIVSKSSYSKWGDATESLTDYTGIKCMVNLFTENDQEVKEGIFKAGDIRFFFASTQTLNRGDRIQFNNQWYEVNDIVFHSVANTVLVKEARVEKV